MVELVERKFDLDYEDENGISQGDRLASVARQLRKRGIVNKEGEGAVPAKGRPEEELPPPPLMYLWIWFWTLHSTRSCGMGPEPIKMESILALSCLEGIRMRRWEIEFLVRADRAFFAIYADREKQRAASRKAMAARPPSRVGKRG